MPNKTGDQFKLTETKTKLINCNCIAIF